MEGLFQYLNSKSQYSDVSGMWVYDIQIPTAFIIKDTNFRVEPFFVW